MQRVLKWIGLVLGSLLGIVILAALVLFLIGSARFNKVYDFPPSNLTQPTDAASLEFGRHRVETLCQGCHGADLSGLNNWFNGGPLGTIDSANLTSGKGGIGGEFTTEDYVRSIRHGISRDGKPIFMVAVASTAHLSDADLAAIIAYLKTIPPVDHETHGQRLSPVAKIMLAAGLLGKLSAEAVNHEINVTAPARGVTAAYGEYLVNTNDCHVCHGPELAGGKYPNPTIQKISPNLTPGGEPGFWTEAQFINTLRTGTTPSGQALNPDLMPWQVYRLFTDDELKAIYMYLQSLPKLEQYAP